MNEEFRIIAQSYCGMTPKDKGCQTWSEMQQKMADELEAVVKNKVKLSKEEINTAIEAKAQYHLKGMKKDYGKTVTIEFASLCCGNSFEEGIKWATDKFK